MAREPEDLATALSRIAVPHSPTVQVAARHVRHRRMREGKPIFNSPEEDTFSPTFTQKLKQHGYSYHPKQEAWRKTRLPSNAAGGKNIFGPGNGAVRS